MPPKPLIREMVREAIDALGATTNSDLRDWVVKKYPGTNPASVNAHITMMTVNHPSRSHFPEAKKPRGFDERYDVLYRPARGRLERYEPSRHGHWALAPNPAGGRAKVVLGGEAPAAVDGEASLDPGAIEASNVERVAAFAEEDHLRDFLAEHPELIEPGLRLYEDESGVPGIEYTIPGIGRMDLLCVDTLGGFVVVELKVGRGHHAVAGQVLLYKNWLERNLAKGNRVRGFVIAETIDNRIRMALAGQQGIELREYQMEFSLKTVAALD